MIACSRSLTRVDRVLKFTNTYLASNSRPTRYYLQLGQGAYHCLSYNFMTGGRKKKICLEDDSMKQKKVNSIWRPVATKASACEDRGTVQEAGCSTSTTVSSDHVMKVAAEAIDEIAKSATSSSQLQDNVENRVLQGDSSVSSEKHAISVQVGASLFRFIKGKGGSTQKRIEEQMGVKIIIPTSKEEDFISIEGISIDSVNSASKRIQDIIDESVNSRNLDYSHFISLPLAIHPELVNKLINFQHSILGNVSYKDESTDTDSNEEEGTTDPKDLGIDKSIFIKPKTFHLTVLMLKLWNKERIKTATEVLQSISSKVMETLDNRPLSIRLKGLECMKGSLAKARVLYAPVEEIGSEGRLLRACQVIIDAYVEAGLVLESDAKDKLKLHATVMNARHRKRNKWKRKVDSFYARGIFEQYGSEDWGQYLIHEAHLSQRFSFDENGYYHCCASIPFPGNVHVE
ncbi:uncharacterized protein LOC108334018 isoform X2 [Vigna angularis]|uniref:uncharacterized protein LOC108334018 isoform X2 n=1 Tax=Phaseolus angularis TaxID=3914 RepID=UPI00080A7124|nr:uncharacterized protein LOC108334018 isoform X2 [Vigna angularis]